MAQPVNEKVSDNVTLKEALATNADDFWERLEKRSVASDTFEDLLFLVNMGKRALRQGIASQNRRGRKCRLAVIGAGTLYPLHEFIRHLLVVRGIDAEVFVGEYDNYLQEIFDDESGLYGFKPDVVVLFPSPERCAYTGHLADAPEKQREAAMEVSREIIRLCNTIRERAAAEVIVANFALPGRFDMGPYRAATLGSSWSFRKLVNLETGLGLNSIARVCDVEFLSCRNGTINAHDHRKWLESKQLYAPDFQVAVTKEIAHIVNSLYSTTKKVVVLDLDNTIWGGIVGDDGLEGIEIGDTSARGEAFKAFQKYLLELKDRGILLAVCSKNDHDKAAEPFEKHPEMVIRLSDLVSFKANWRPKSDNIREMAEELNLGLDSFVFVDDNPAEIEIVRQFIPEVTTILVDADPADSIALLSDSRLFEPMRITAEDRQRTDMYRQDASRRAHLSKMTDMDAYLGSLEMKAVVSPFKPVDIPRITQLINKSNQFNLTTRRRTEAEVRGVMEDPLCHAFTVRLLDMFGDHGLISVVVCKENAGEDALEVDTWLMSCRVLNRQVEDEVINEIVRIGDTRGLKKIIGRYYPTKKNGMVSKIYEHVGFQTEQADESGSVYSLEIKGYSIKETKISVKREYDNGAG